MAGIHGQADGRRCRRATRWPRDKRKRLDPLLSIVQSSGEPVRQLYNVMGVHSANS